MCETLSLANQEHHGFSRSVFGVCVGPRGRGWHGSQLFLPTRLVLSSNPHAHVSAGGPGL